MFRFFAIVLFIKLVAGDEPEVSSGDDNKGKIIGGKNANIFDYPYQLSLQYTGRHSCGAAIIGSTWAVTAAHCTDKLPASALSVRAGSSILEFGGQVIQVKAIHQHSQYSPTDIDYDISVLELEKPFTHRYAKPIALVLPSRSVREGSIATVTGWGTTTENGFASRHLKVVEIPVISQEMCKSAYSNISITNRMFCAGYVGVGGKDACQGDSGGPLVIDGVLTGVVSWGFGCARPNYPGVYSSVSALREFITSVCGI